MKEKIDVLISEEEVTSRIKELGAQISREYEGKEIHMVCVLKGGVYFMTELSKRISVPVTVDFMCIQLWGRDKEQRDRKDC